LLDPPTIATLQVEAKIRTPLPFATLCKLKRRYDLPPNYTVAKISSSHRECQAMQKKILFSNHLIRRLLETVGFGSLDDRGAST
jgi:hypothetical protein